MTLKHDGMNFVLCPKLGVVEWCPKQGGYFRIFFVLNGVRVFEWLTYTQILVGYHGALEPLSYRLY